jgi:hypothetical protein
MGAASREVPTTPTSAPADQSSPAGLKAGPVFPPSWAAADPAVTTAAASRTRRVGRRRAVIAAAMMMTSGAAPMMTPTLAGSAIRVAWIISTLHPASPTMARAASQAHSRLVGRGRGWWVNRAQATRRSPAARYRTAWPPRTG